MERYTQLRINETIHIYIIIYKNAGVHVIKLMLYSNKVITFFRVFFFVCTLIYNTLHRKGFIVFELI